MTAVKRGELEPDAKPAQLAQVSVGGRGSESGISQAARETGVSRRQLQRQS
jgi:hypothetical protein